MKTFYKTVAAFLMVVALCATAEAQNLNISYDKFMENFKDGFVMQEIPLQGGKKTYRGQTPDGFALLEIMGPKRNIEEVSVILAVPRDRPDVYKRNSYVIDLFLSTLTLKEEASSWVASAMNNLAKANRLVVEEKTFKSKRIIVQQAPNLGYKITVKAIAYAEEKKPVAAVERKVAQNPLAVTGIVLEESRTAGEGAAPVALIGGKMYKQGDTVQNLKIQTIGKNYVEFLDKDGQVSRQELGK